MIRYYESGPMEYQNAIEQLGADEWLRLLLVTYEHIITRRTAPAAIFDTLGLYGGFYENVVDYLGLVKEGTDED